MNAQIVNELNVQFDDKIRVSDVVEMLYEYECERIQKREKEISKRKHELNQETIQKKQEYADKLAEQEIKIRKYVLSNISVKNYMGDQFTISVQGLDKYGAKISFDFNKPKNTIQKILNKIMEEHNELDKEYSTLVVPTKSKFKAAFTKKRLEQDPQTGQKVLDLVKSLDVQKMLEQK